MGKPIRYVLSYKAFRPVKGEPNKTEQLCGTDSFVFDNINKERDPYLSMINEITRHCKEGGYGVPFVTGIWEMPFNPNGRTQDIYKHGERF